MSKTPSLAHQVNEIFMRGSAIGRSRDAAKNEMRAEGHDVRGMADGIHSWGTMRTLQSAAIHVAKSIKAKYGSRVKWIADFTPPMIQDYLSQRLEARKSKNTLVSEVLALRRLERLALAQGKIREPFMPSPKVLREMGIRREFSAHGAYTPHEARVIIQAVTNRDPRTGLILELQYGAGLRVREAVCLRNGLIRDRKAGVERPGIDTVHGTVFVAGKGGRQREIALLEPNVLDRLDTSKLFPLRNSQLIQTQIRAVERVVRKACRELRIKERGTHAFRAAAAREFYARQLAAGVSVRQARRATANWLGHNRVDILRHYLESGRKEPVEA